MVTRRLWCPISRPADWCVYEILNLIMFSRKWLDDEKFLFKQDLKIEQTRKFASQNAKDIIAVGFDLKKTFIFSDYDFIGGAFYRNVSRISRCITLNQAKNTFGFEESSVFRSTIWLTFTVWSEITLGKFILRLFKLHHLSRIHFHTYSARSVTYLVSFHAPSTKILTSASHGMLQPSSSIPNLRLYMQSSSLHYKVHKRRCPHRIRIRASSWRTRLIRLRRR